MVAASFKFFVITDALKEYPYMLELINRYFVEYIPNNDATKQKIEDRKYVSSLLNINKVIAIPVIGNENHITYILSE